jgi:hypothetical protein
MACLSQLFYRGLLVGTLRVRIGFQIQHDAGSCLCGKHAVSGAASAAPRPCFDFVRRDLFNFFGASSFFIYPTLIRCAFR